MRIVALLMLQGGTAGMAPPAGDVVHLQPVLPDRRCDQESTDIVVCGKRRDDRYRLPRLDSARFEPRAARKAEIGLGGNVKGAAEVESATVGPGLISNRVMLRLKMPF
jgi:hypothetical protein